MTQRASASSAILLLEPLHADATQQLADHARVFQVETPEQAMAVAKANDVVAILTRGKGRVTRELIVACKNLRVISRVGAGVDTVDLDTATAYEIPVIYGPGINAATTAEHALMLMLMITRRAAELSAAVKAGDWAIRDAFSGVELRWKTLGIFGMGAIGREVAARAKAFGMRIVAVSRRPIAAVVIAGGVQQVELDALLAGSDVISLHVPLTEQTRGIFGRAEFERMKPGAFLINTARGALIDKSALAQALDSGRLAGYAADVFHPQPPEQEDAALINRPNVILTPHIGGITDATFRQLCLFCAGNVLAVLQGGMPDARSVFKRGE